MMKTMTNLTLLIKYASTELAKAFKQVTKGKEKSAEGASSEETY